MTVYITGMHRSGTSMIARLLNLCGLYLGPEEGLIPPKADNPAGFWENCTVLKINEAILDKLGGGWDYLPRGIKACWERNSSLEPIRDIAKGLIRDFNEQEPWGWKDPRFCFTLPFWQSLLTESKVVVSLRHPLEVVGSLMKRNGLSRAFGLNLWLEYNQRLLELSTPEQRIVTHYNAYFINPQQEMRRLVDWLGWSVPEETILQACKTISTSLRHHRRPERHNQPGDMPNEVARLYSTLESDAGPVYNEEHPAKGDPQPSDTAPSVPPIPENAAQGLKDMPQKARTLYSEARKLIEAKKIEASITALKALLEAFPEYAAAHNDLAVVYFKTGNQSEALHHLEQAAKLDPSNFNTLHNLGDVYRATGRMEEALAAYERITQGEPQNADAWLMHASANCQLGRIDDARESLDRTLEINPEHPAIGQLLKAINLLARP